MVEDIKLACEGVLGLPATVLQRLDLRATAEDLLEALDQVSAQNHADVPLNAHLPHDAPPHVLVRWGIEYCIQHVSPAEDAKRLVHPNGSEVGKALSKRITAAPGVRVYILALLTLPLRISELKLI